MEAIIEARKVEKSYGSEGKGSVQVIAPTDLAIYPGEILAVLAHPVPANPLCCAC